MTIKALVREGVQSRMIVQLGGRGCWRAAVPQNHTARQEPRPPGIRLHLKFAEIHDRTRRDAFHGKTLRNS